MTNAALTSTQAVSPAFTSPPVNLLIAGKHPIALFRGIAREVSSV
jgi:hypothetical protein